MKGAARCYGKLREYLGTVPLIDCHDHSGECGPKYADPIQMAATGYFASDLHSASSDRDMDIMCVTERPFEERWAAFERAWKRSRHTGYARVVKIAIKKFYGEDDLTRESYARIKDKMLNLQAPSVFEGILEDAKIAARLEDVWPDTRKVLDGTLKLTPRARLVIGIPGYHAICNYDGVQSMVAPLNRRVTSLDEYIAACREIFEGWKRFGAVAFKDQSAYSRSLDYGNPTRAEAEAVFNWIVEDPRRRASYPDQIKPLDDFLFHEFMRMARDMELPVQIHTGHMAGIRNDIAKTNAVHLTKVLELHRDVKFDLFHANWPYSGELLYLAKNFPNVAIDFCWANIIDPVYCQNMFKQALSSVPHGKIHGYGSDYCGQVEMSWAHAKIARDNIAIALSDMVEMEYLDLDEAKEVARAWMFDNANEFFKLGVKA
ncbi:MAG TPA: amidohydrolase family protein [Candidatus Brocadiia bacterium]|nr:amidohydrolase family protein [Candidatus Brocadiia bacterium]